MKASLFTAAVLLAANAVWQPASGQEAPSPEARVLYNTNCRDCHGVRGVPPKTMKKKYKNIADLSDAAFMAKRSDDSLLVVIKKGVNDEREMKGFADRLSVEEMKTIISYVRSLAVKKE